MHASHQAWHTEVVKRLPGAVDTELYPGAHADNHQHDDEMER
jgi:hypothetical protein